MLTLVAETEQPARVDGYEEASGEAAEIARRHGWRSSIAAPISVEGRLWGVMLVATEGLEPFAAGAEERLAAARSEAAALSGELGDAREQLGSLRQAIAERDDNDGDQLDWSAFLGRFFPNRHRHDRAALAAYEAYRDSVQASAERPAR